jgi:hypothetical protein
MGAPCFASQWQQRECGPRLLLRMLLLWQLGAPPVKVGEAEDVWTQMAEPRPELAPLGYSRLTYRHLS